MSNATDREFRADPAGHKRLVAAAGDADVASNAVAAGPAGPTMAGANYSPTPNVDTVGGSTPIVATAGNDATHVIGEVKRDGKVTSVVYIPDAAITGAATNNRTVSVVNKGQDGTGTTVIGTLQFGSGINAAVGDEKALTLSGTASDLKVAKGDVLAFVSTHVGTGIADPGGYAVVTVQPTDT